jgi:nitrilase
MPRSASLVGLAPTGVIPQNNSIRECSFYDPAVLAGPQYDGEGVLSVEVDTGEIAEGKFDLDVTGHYARPDVFRLDVNEL